MKPTQHTPCHQHIKVGDLDYTAEQINQLLSLIPYKADRKEISALISFTGQNYIGHYPSATLLKPQDRFAWALVGSLSAAAPYFFYTAGNEPEGYTAGWNNMQPVFGTYDLAQEDKEDEITSEDFMRIPLHLPLLTADRAIADEHGNRIADTYETRQAVRNHIREVYNEQFIENPPLILDEYITPGMLSEGVKDMLSKAGATITNVPDGEDLTTKQGVLKLSDKPYNPGAYSGLGRVYLRKNLVGGQNLLTQAMVSKPNTIYILQYDYTLDGKSITIPEGCVLSYEGGSIRDGHINYTDTLIEGKESLNNVTEAGAAIHRDNEERKLNGQGMDCIILKKTPYLTQDMVNQPNTIYIIRYNFDLNGAEITIPEGCVLNFQGGSLNNGIIKGNILNEYIKPEWFGAIDDGLFDNTIIFQNIVNYVGKNKTILLEGKKYRITDTIYLSGSTNIVGNYNAQGYSALGAYRNTGEYPDISIIFADFEGDKFVFDSDVTDASGNRFPYNSRMSASTVMNGNIVSSNIKNINIIGNCHGGIRLFKWIGGIIENVAITGVKTGIIIGRSWSSYINKCVLQTKVFGLVAAGEVTTLRVDSVGSTGRFLDYNITEEDTAIIGGSLFSSFDVDWLVKSSISFVILTSNITLTNCHGERSDVSILCRNSDVLLNGYYAELNYKSVIMNYTSKVEVNSLYGSNLKSIFTEEQWNNRYYDYVTTTRGTIIFNNAAGGSLKHSHDTIASNRKTFNVSPFIINSENFERDGFTYLENNELLEVSHIPDNIYVDDSIEDDSVNWGFTRTTPIKFDSLVERLSSQYYNNIYKRKRFNVWLLNDCTYHLTDKTIRDFDVVIKPYSDTKSQKINLNNSLIIGEGSIEFNRVVLVSTDNVIQVPSSKSKGVDISFKECNFECKALIQLLGTGSINLTIDGCTLPNDVKTLYYNGNNAYNYPVRIKASNNNIDISYKNNYLCDFLITSLVKSFVFSKEERPILGSNVVGYLTYVSSENVGYIWNGKEWVSLLYDKCSTTSHRPVDAESGCFYFDTTLNKPIWWTGSKWVDATGAEV